MHQAIYRRKGVGWSCLHSNSTLEHMDAILSDEDDEDSLKMIEWIQFVFNIHS